MIPGNANPLLLASAAADGAAAGVATKSLRFDDGSSAYLSRTASSAGNSKTFTWSGWIKRTEFGGNKTFFSSATSNTSNPRTDWQFNNDALYIAFNPSGSSWLEVITDRVFRDPSAWYHIVVAVDTTQGTNTDRVKVYVNGVRETSFSTYSTFTQDSGVHINSAVQHSIGRYEAGDSNYFPGHIADLYMVDGLQLDATSFGAYDDNGVWQAAAYSGTFGTNGFHLDFADGLDLGDDNSGNNNDFTPYNLSGIDGSVATANGALPILNTTGHYGGTVGSGTRTDSNSSNIVLALPLNGANNGTTWSDQSATIKGSGSAKTITANNDAKTSTAESFFYGSSTYFDGNGDRLVLTNASDLSFTGDFTVETWLYISDSTTTSYPNGDRQIVGVWSGSDNDWLMTYSGTGSHNTFLFQIHTGGSTVFFSSGVDMSNYVGQWVHLATVRSSNSIQNYVNGVASGSAYSNSASFGQSSNVAVGGRVGSDGNSVKGYLSDLRIYLSAKYTGNFDVPSRTGGSGCDSLFDVPTNGSQSDTGAGGEVSGNYCVLNPIDANSTASFANGNLDWTGTNGNGVCRGTIAVSSGKWYWEYTYDAKPSGGGTGFGILEVSEVRDFIGAANAPDGYSYYSEGSSFTKKYNNGSNSNYGASFAPGDVISVALDMDGGTITFYKNGASQGQAFSGISGTYAPALNSGTSVGTAKATFNAGQRAFAYSAPSGYKALCTTNLPTGTIADGSDYFDVALYTGNASTQSISGLSFSPDLVWLKQRSDANSHFLLDVVRGFSNGSALELRSNGNNDEGVPSAASTGLTSFDSNGFSIGSDSGINVDNGTFVGWAWDAGSSTASNTDGSITSSVRASQTAGMSIVSYTGTGSNATVGHGLNAVPELIIVKCRSNDENWRVYTKTTGNTKSLFISTEEAPNSASNYWNSTSPTSSVFSVGTDSGSNNNNFTYIAYCFAPVAGYSAFGSYEASSSLPFIYTGFRVAFLMVKNIDSGSTNWRIMDSTRDTFNDGSGAKWLKPNSTGQEVDERPVDFLSNGFKMRMTDGGDINYSTDTYIYWAVAENPFQANGGLAR